VKLNLVNIDIALVTVFYTGNEIWRLHH